MGLWRTWRRRRTPTQLHSSLPTGALAAGAAACCAAFKGSPPTTLTPCTPPPCPARLAAAAATICAALGLKEEAASQGERRELLRALGVLVNQLVVPGAKPLTDELLTAAQVLMMPEEAFAEYQQQYGGAAEARAPGDAAAGLLGDGMLEDPDFRRARGDWGRGQRRGGWEQRWRAAWAGVAL